MARPPPLSHVTLDFAVTAPAEHVKSAWRETEAEYRFSDRCERLSWRAYPMQPGARA